MAGVYKPTGGAVDIYGAPCGLFNTSMGMDSTATGLENIYLRGLQMGKKFSNIKENLPEILDFARLGEAIHDPINTYSGGMRGRLVFAISTLIDPDILILDEWIGGGDELFKEKMAARIQEIVDKSRGVVVTTHNTDLIKQLCAKGRGRGIVLKGGRIVFFGDIESAVKFHQESMRQARLEAEQAKLEAEQAKLEAEHQATAA